VIAEYRSAATTHHFTHWLIQAGASPDLIRAGLKIVADELDHAALAAEVCVAAGAGPASSTPIAPASLRLVEPPPDHDGFIETILDQTVALYCVGETVAVPLFRMLNQRCDQPTARRALDRVLRDEPRHSRFGWTLLDWALATEPIPHTVHYLQNGVANHVDHLLRAYLAILSPNEPAPIESGTTRLLSVTDDERRWGVAAAGDYASVAYRACATVVRRRFAERGLTLELPTPSA